MNDNTVPDEYMHCFNVTDDYVATEPMELEVLPDVAETVALEWHSWQPGQEKPAPTKEDQLGMKALVKLSDFQQWKAIQELIDLVMMVGMSARAAGLLIGINVRTAQYYVKKYKDDDEKRVPLPRSAANISFANNRKLYQEHTDFLCEVFDKRADLTLWEARDMLLNTFPEIYSITLSALHKHLVNKASVTLKKLDKFTAPRGAQTTIDTRHARVLEWTKDPDMRWESNCVFVDEAGFNLHIRRNFGRSIKGKPARVIVPANRGVLITIVGAICELGIIDLSLKRPQAQVKKSWNSHSTLSSLSFWSLG
ncbi:hypothetical protein BD408DRAFT_467723 [Parasitella parasitica]|nr:hypothetical protein BD408DRAFT_467723 [Parasitella parasitica]